MELNELKAAVYKANLDLVRNGLVLYTWGNVSGIDREKGVIVIKPSGVDYDRMTADDMVVVDMEGKTIDSKYRPSSDTPTHLELYRRFPEIAGVAHTHSTFATAWAQSGRDVPFYGTTHADYFYGDVPCTRALTKEEIDGEYELNTGKVIVERMRGIEPLAVPAAIVASHGPFSWGSSPDNAVYNATVLEQVAKLAYLTESLKPDAERADRNMMEKHYLRKHGKNAYYGQK